MDGMYGGLHSTTGDHDYADRALMSDPAVDYLQYHQYSSMFSSSGDPRNIPVFGSEELGFQCSAAAWESVSINAQNHHHHHHPSHDEEAVKSKIASHPCYPKLIDAYIDCQKVGATSEIASLLDEIRREKGFKYQTDSVQICLGRDPDLDEFMETYYKILVKYKSDLSRPFDEATSFLNKIQTQLGNLCSKDDDGSLSSDDEFSGGETEAPDAQTRTEDRELKDTLLRRYGGHISSLKLEFSKNKKKGKLPKESRQTLLDWWNVHYKWPYPTEADKISLAETTRLDQKQINNWFINQRKRHWKPSENIQLAMMNNLSGHFFSED